MVSSNIGWYNSLSILQNPKFFGLSGFDLYETFHRIFIHNLAVVDRSNTVRFPIIHQCEDFLSLPKYKPFNKSYEEVCIGRAVELMEYAKRTGRKIYILYSGGIDSSCIICSFLVGCSKQDINDCVVLLLNDKSIVEHPVLYNKHILQNFVIKSSGQFTKYFNKSVILLHGECNDQLMGHDKYIMIKDKWGFDKLLEKCTDDNLLEILKYFAHSTGNFSGEKDVDKLTEEVYDKILLPIVNNSDLKDLIMSEIRLFFWYLNLTLKFQNVYYRVQAFRSRGSDYILKNEDSYMCFYSTEDFTLWSFNNTDKFTGTSLKEHKLPSKNFIYSVTHDDEYLINKTKVNSLGALVKSMKTTNIIYGNGDVSSEEISKNYWKGFGF